MYAIPIKPIKDKASYFFLSYKDENGEYSIFVVQNWNKMKKHAFLIGAYQNPDYLLSLVNSLDSERSNIYIHINKQFIADFSDFIKSVSDRPNIIVVNPIYVRWGGQTLLQSMMRMLDVARMSLDNNWFHFITGQDILIKPLSCLFEFFDNHPDENYIEYGSDLLSLDSKSYLIGINRSQHYHLFDYLNYRGNRLHRQIEKWFVRTQQLLHLKRKWPFPNYYQGSGWFSLNRKAIDVLTDYLIKHSDVIKFTFAPDEVIIQSVILNNKEKLNVVNNNLRLIVWDNRGEVGSPVILTEEHIDIIKKTDRFFARKIDPIRSKRLIEILINKDIKQ